MMEAVSAAAVTEVDLWRGLPDDGWTRRRWAIAAASAALHLLLFTGALRLPEFTSHPRIERRVIVHRTKLYLPPDVLTQRAANRSKVSKNIDLADLLSKNEAAAQQASPAPSRRRFEMPKTAPQVTPKHAKPVILPDAPQVPQTQQTATMPPGTLGALATTAPPPPKPVDSQFQNIGAETPPAANPTLRPPKADLDSTIAGLAQNNAGRHLTVSDDNASTPAPGTAGGAGRSGGAHAAVELQSDPQGADFKAYLTRILAIVRGNWQRVIPESARMGTLRGRSTVEFIINREGNIPRLVIANSSGSDSLDRAAAAGLSMSNPLPPLPADYRGFEVRLAFTFTYNMPSQ